ncbi:hypothetical protein BDQ17DRAFT_1424329 [Cyathus striatus]|nr:hypothetical protein BDQ17DRAFT_1424329 [Cyathus striatus]
MPIPGSSLCRPALPHQAIAALLLIENSQAMANIWSDLRDRYLSKLIENFQNINKSASIKFLVLESFPAEEWQSGSAHGPRHYSDLQGGLLDVRFNYASGNKLSISDSDFPQNSWTAYRSAFDYCSCFPPAESDITFGIPPVVSPWHLLAKRFKQADIHCHMVLNPHQDMFALEALFDETLRVQHHFEEYPPFPADSTQVKFRLSGGPHQDNYSDTVPFTNAGGRDMPPQKSNTFPPDNAYPPSFPEQTAAFSETNNESDSPPSLVTQLQQVHGLTKKKVYGTKPPRQPFFREERVREKYHNMPAPLSVPSSYGAAHQALLLNTGGRVVPPSKVDRIMRMNQASPTELHSRRWASRRGSGVSSPDSDTVTTPIGLPFAVSPTFANNPYRTSPPLPQQPTNTSTQLNTTSEPTWHSGQPPTSAVSYYPRSMSGQYPDILQQGQVAHSSSLSPSPPASGPLYSPATPDASRSINRNSSSSEKGGLRRGDTTASQCPSPRRPRSYAQDDERFTFGPEYVAATTALFTQEVLPSYPDFSAIGELVQLNRRSEPPPNRSDFCNAEIIQSSTIAPQYLAGNHYAPTRPRQETMYPMTTNGHSALETITYPSAYSSENSSSLKGWAG